MTLPTSLKSYYNILGSLPQVYSDGLDFKADYTDTIQYMPYWNGFQGYAMEALKLGQTDSLFSTKVIPAGSDVTTWRRMGYTTTSEYFLNTKFQENPMTPKEPLTVTSRRWSHLERVDRAEETTRWTTLQQEIGPKIANAFGRRKDANLIDLLTEHNYLTKNIITASDIDGNPSNMSRTVSAIISDEFGKSFASPDEPIIVLLPSHQYLQLVLDPAIQSTFTYPGASELAKTGSPTVVLNNCIFLRVQDFTPGMLYETMSGEIISDNEKIRSIGRNGYAFTRNAIINTEFASCRYYQVSEDPNSIQLIHKALMSDSKYIIEPNLVKKIVFKN